MEELPKAQDRLAAIAASIKAGERPPPVTVRTMLQWFDAQRRGIWVTSTIKVALKRAGLRTEPDFESAFIDGHIRFVEDEKLAAPLSGRIPADVPKKPEFAAGAAEGAGSLPEVFADPTHRISKLAAANSPPRCVHPDTPIAEAITVMLAHDYSQLPVMPTERDLWGIVSWHSIGSRLVLGQTPKAARDAVDPIEVLPLDASFMKAIPPIVDHGCVLVQAKDRRIVGIITTTDLNIQFQQFAEPFLLLGEIENHIRRILGKCLTKAELRAARDPKDGGRKVEGVADLSFGEYQTLLEKAEIWDRVALKMDRVEFVKQIDRVRTIRNDVMHFDPDGIEESDLKQLRSFVRFLQKLVSIGVT